jgi:hypothetical protein
MMPSSHIGVGAAIGILLIKGLLIFGNTDFGKIAIPNSEATSSIIKSH